MSTITVPEEVYTGLRNARKELVATTRKLRERVAELEAENIEFRDKVKALEVREVREPDKFSLAALCRLVDMVELVFDNDWDMTRYEIANECSIDPKGSFLNPLVSDESDNWWNRGAFLCEFRRALRMVDAARSHGNTESEG